MDDAEAADEGQEQNRTTWAPVGGAAAAAGAPGPPPGSRKRPADDFEDEDELPDEVRARLEALKRAG